MLDGWLETSGNTAFVMNLADFQGHLGAKVATHLMKLAELWKQDSKHCRTAHKTCIHSSEAFFVWISGMRTTGPSQEFLQISLFALFHLIFTHLHGSWLHVFKIQEISIEVVAISLPPQVSGLLKRIS